MSKPCLVVHGNARLVHEINVFSVLQPIDAQPPTFFLVSRRCALERDVISDVDRQSGRGGGDDARPVCSTTSHPSYTIEIGVQNMVQGPVPQKSLQILDLSFVFKIF
jgi:hypothetical protein